MSGRPNRPRDDRAGPKRSGGGAARGPGGPGGHGGRAGMGGRGGGRPSGGAGRPNGFGRDAGMPRDATRPVDPGSARGAGGPKGAFRGSGFRSGGPPRPGRGFVPRRGAGFAAGQPDRADRADVPRDRSGPAERVRRPPSPWPDHRPGPPPGQPAAGRRPAGPCPTGAPPWARGGQPPGRRPVGDRAPGRPVEPPPRPTSPAPELEPGEELIAGRRPVEEAFAAHRPARRLLVTPQRRQALERIVLHATTLRIPIVEVEGGSLTSLAGFDGHQGVAVVVDERRFASVDDLLARSIERVEPAFVLVLDSLEDPQNVGTLLRSAEAAGVHGVVFPTERQAPLTPAAIKASAGATEHLLLAPVDDLPGALTDLHLRGLRIVGSDAEAALSAREADLRGPTAIVVGSEGHGLSPAIRRRCDLFVRIPMRGAIGSLNAAVAGSILLFEALGQRDPGARPETA
jgi:23S rRNA (guanosine2251-2'-O)-methyltransferase